MLNVFRREIKANLKGLLIWCVVIALMCGLGFMEYGMVVKGGSEADIGSVVDMMPRIVRIMFGMGAISVNTPEGWYACMYLWCAIIAYIHASLLGAGIISKEEDDKTAEFLFTRPLARSGAVGGKMLAAAVNALAVAVSCWLTALAVFGPHIKGSALVSDIHLSMFLMYLTSLVFLLIGMLAASALAGRGKAAQYSLLAFFSSYFLYIVVEAVEGIGFLGILSPFRYFDAGRLLTVGIEGVYLAAALVIIAVCACLTVLFYKKRNLHS